MSLNSRGNLSWNDDFATGWSCSNFYAIFSVNRYAYCVWLLHKYEAHMKGLPICFSEVQVKNDVTDNNNKHFVTAFEGECRNIIELREHLKLCFLIILLFLLQEISNSSEVVDQGNARCFPGVYWSGHRHFAQSLWAPRAWGAKMSQALVQLFWRISSLTNVQTICIRMPAAPSIKAQITQCSIHLFWIIISLKNVRHVQF